MAVTWIYQFENCKADWWITSKLPFFGLHKLNFRSAMLLWKFSFLAHAVSRVCQVIDFISVSRQSWQRMLSCRKQPFRKSYFQWFRFHICKWKYSITDEMLDGKRRQDFGNQNFWHVWSIQIFLHELETKVCADVDDIHVMENWFQGLSNSLNAWLRLVLPKTTKKLSCLFAFRSVLSVQ